MDHKHLHHLIIVGAIILVGVCMEVWRFHRATKGGEYKRISQGKIILLICLFIYGGIMRIFQHPQFAEYLALAWVIPLLVIGYNCYLRAKKFVIKRDKDRKFLVPNRLYVTLLLWLIPYALLSVTLGLLDPALIDNFYYLLISNLIKGCIAGFYIGYGVGFISFHQDIDAE